jgi:8-amino-7-oxononanoate synthase
LGLSEEPALQKVLGQAVLEKPWGSTGSRLLSGDYDVFHSLEEALAKFTGRESALVFNSGYQVNVGVASVLVSKGDIVLADRLAHASLLDGARLSGAKLVRYRHNDLGHLRSLLEHHRKENHRALLVSESLFSMDGDFAPLDALIDLKKEFDCQLLVDEAHAFGVFGPEGAGLTKSKDVDVVVGTFGKALGSYGAFAACSAALKERLIQSARSFVYSTALPPALIEWNLAALKMAGGLANRRETLKTSWEILGGESPIVPIRIGEVEATVKKAEELREKGFWVLPICPPSVPAGEARLRLSLNWFLAKEVIRELKVGLE